MPSRKAREEPGRKKRAHSAGSKALSTATDQSDDGQKHPWRALFFFTTKANIPILVLGMLFSLLAGAMVPATAYVEGKLFDGFTSYATGKIDVDEFFHKEKKYIYYLLAVAGGSWLFNFVEMTVWIAFGELQAKSARDRLFHGLLKKEIAWYDLRKNGIGALLPRIQAQIRELQLATSQPLGSGVSLISTAILSLVQALYKSWDLTLVSIASTPIIMLVVLWIGRNLQRNYDLQQKKLTEAQKYTSSAFTAIETVKCFNGQDIEHDKYMKKVAEAAKLYYRVASANALQVAIFVLLSISMFVQGFYYGGLLIRQHKKSVADVLTTFLSAVGAFQALNGIIPTLLFLEKGKIAGSTLRTIMAEMLRGSDVKDEQRLLAPPGCLGNIDVKNVTFAYPSLPQQLALDDVTLYIPGGEMTFIIGKSGSGKSTLGQLLLRFYHSQSGLISLDDINIDRLDLAWLRTNITLVEQTSMLFNDTVFNNIAFGKRDHSKVSKQEVQKAVEFALLQLMITDRPNGLDTIVGYKGGSMSGGQRQRMALARARLRDTPVLLLDESTSALDQISRGLMMDAIRQWRHGKTTIVITHDISQIEQDDYAYILEHGKLVQEGSRKHMEKIRDSPFQGFLPPDQRATASPFDSRKHTAFESIRTRGSSIDSMSYRFSRITSDPLEAHLDASENKRTSAMFNVFKENRPVHGVGPGAFAAPWMRLAASPPSPEDVSPRLNRSPGWWDPKPFKATIAEEPTSGKRMSRVLEGILEKTGMSAAESRGIAAGQRRQRKEVIPMADFDDDDPSNTTSMVGDSSDEESQVVSQKSYKQLLATVWPSIDRRAKAALLFGCYCTTIHALGSPIFGYVLSKLLRTYSIPGGDKQAALMYSMIMLGIAVVDSTHTYFGHICLEYVGQRWVDSIRSQATNKILDQPRAFFDKEENAVSRLTGNLDRNAEELRNLVGRFSALIWTAATMSSVAVVWTLIAHWKMTLISLAAAPYIFVVTKIYAAVSSKWEIHSNGAAEDAASIFTEAFTNIKTVRALTLEQHFVDKYTKATKWALNVGLMRSFFSGFFYGISDSAGNFAIAMVFYVGARLVKSGTPVQHVVQVFTMLIFTITNLSMILVSIPQIGSTKDTGSRLLRLVELPADSHEHQGDTRIKAVGDIIFEDLRFAYPSRPDQAVLHNINLHIQPGASTAIVGGSGSGKSTIANLLLNLYGIDTELGNYNRNGELILGGRGINHINTSSLRSLVVPVSQTPTLFSATVAENVAYGLPSDSPYNNMTAIRDAAARAGIHDFIVSLPRGYDTLIGDGGLGLSGGQAQRVNIARALVRRPAVLILDECTSALDVESANLVRETIEQLVRDPSMKLTVIIITHHRDMMAIADHVVVLDQGQIVEEGGFEELLAKNGALANLLSGGEWNDTRQESKPRPRGRDGIFKKDVEWKKRAGNKSVRR